MTVRAIALVEKTLGLMPLMTWQLWLARECVIDAPLPWQKPMAQLSPGRAANAFALLLVRIGSPAPETQTSRAVSWLGAWKGTNATASLSDL